MAFQKGSYVPDLSFGTHFFQDLVEAGIRYLPLYPDDSSVVFNKAFFEKSENVLCHILPDCGNLDHVVKVIDVKASTGGRILRIAMSGEEGEAIAYLANADDLDQKEPDRLLHTRNATDSNPDEHWLWRQRMAETMASNIDPDQYGVKGIYLFGSTKNASSGPCSDIDLLIHFEGDDNARELLKSYLSGWDTSLCEMNYIRTGFKTEHLLDVHIVTDKDIEEKQSYAIKIGSVSDPARPLKMKSKKG
jgi:predicted nucleotidyltransferase